jgi:hypothetical protein
MGIGAVYVINERFKIARRDQERRLILGSEDPDFVKSLLAATSPDEIRERVEYETSKIEGKARRKAPAPKITRSQPQSNQRP